MWSGRPVRVKRLKLLLLDANIIIELHEMGIWEQVVDLCDVHVSEYIINHEALHFYENGNKNKIHSINLSPDVGAGKITTFAVDKKTVLEFKQSFEKSYFDILDAGEVESLAYLVNSSQPYCICSGDKIVYRVLGSLYLSDRGISLEEIFQTIGYSQKVKHQYSRSFREALSAEGFADGIQSKAFKKNK
jgi:hypothetical protein